MKSLYRTEVAGGLKGSAVGPGDELKGQLVSADDQAVSIDKLKARESQ